MKDLSYCRHEFPSLQRTGPDNLPLVFLDGPGGSQVPASVITAITNYYLNHNANTHGQYATSRESDAVILAARTAMAAMLGAEDPSCISFGQNMTTLNFFLSQAIGRTLNPGDEIIVTELDHDANVAPWLELEERGVIIKHVPVLPSAELDLDAFRALISDRTRVIAVGWASNAVGTVNPLVQIAEWAHEAQALLVVDAVHWAPHGLIDVSPLKPDALLCSAYKFFGPHVGVLYTRPGLLATLPTLRVRPQMPEAPERIETGTLNHAALEGVVAAVDFIAAFADDPDESLRTRIRQAMAHVYHYEHELASKLYRGLGAIPDVRVWGPPVGAQDRAPTISFTVRDRSSIEVAHALGERGILAWDGDFYAVTLVDRLGLRAQGGLVRLGLAPYNTRVEIERTLNTIEDIVTP
ncbi:cysteine desulfurase-like protein [Sulfobacillus harzensis]|uniref:Cysteine desulfurase-like protein n=1 Tax=Sulfobacillus harzensis TaxID=2729629 RepID=A0A7Y0L1Y8_9FIRM|nr:cysteine desulfurase-like protein [Sulfobacillus harzensis]NMP21803.1 cysteine desulfurase-like protein [Sulfobacillus harzensis]